MSSLRLGSRLGVVSVVLIVLNACGAGGARRVVNLDGAWEIAQGGSHAAPKSFDHRAPVPGLADMAKPAFKEVGFKSELREAFWCRRRFGLEGSPPRVAILKIGRSRGCVSRLGAEAHPLRLGLRKLPLHPPHLRFGGAGHDSQEK